MFFTFIGSLSLSQMCAVKFTFVCNTREYTVLHCTWCLGNRSLHYLPQVTCNQGLKIRLPAHPRKFDIGRWRTKSYINL
jgi:hypothetical protein